MKKIIMIVMLLLIILNTILIHHVQAVNIDTAKLYDVGMCGDLLKYKGSTIRVTYVEYKAGGETNPAYCLNANLPGVGELGDYTVSTKDLIKDVGLWKTIINGYPYKTTKELGVANKEEAFTATKQAIYCYIHGNKVEDYEGIGEAGKRTLTAMKKIINDANKSSETMISNIIDIKKESKEWEQDAISPEYVSKTYSIESKGQINHYEVQLGGNLPEGILVTDEKNNKKEEFNGGDKFKIVIPIQNLKQAGEFTIKIDTEVKTKPVFYGKAPKGSMQDYAIAGFMYEDSKKETKDNYDVNETKIKIIKKDEQTKKVMEGVQFSLLDNNQKEIYANLTTDKNGEITITNLQPGKYYLKETKTLEDYEPYPDLIPIDISYNEELTIELDNKKKEKPVVKKEVKKEKVKILPVTGM